MLASIDSMYRVNEEGGERSPAHFEVIRDAEHLEHHQPARPIADEAAQLRLRTLPRPDRSALAPPLRSSPVDCQVRKASSDPRSLFLTRP
jgi:hypothetical protein